MFEFSRPFDIKKLFFFFKALIFIFGSFFFINCAGTLERDLKELDKIYGYCDNPHRNIKGMKYKTCKDKERARGPDGKVDKAKDLNLNDIIDGITGRSDATIVAASTNPFLWRSALEVVESYDLKIADNQGGFIQTEWIYKADTPNNRCMIKIKVHTAELVSTGVTSIINCEEKQDNIWQSDNIVYTNEQKQLTLKILELSQQYSNSTL